MNFKFTKTKLTVSLIIGFIVFLYSFLFAFEFKKEVFQGGYGYTHINFFEALKFKIPYSFLVFFVIFLVIYWIYSLFQKESEGESFGNWQPAALKLSLSIILAFLGGLIADLHNNCIYEALKNGKNIIFDCSEGISERLILFLIVFVIIFLLTYSVWSIIQSRRIIRSPRSGSK